METSSQDRTVTSSQVGFDPAHHPLHDIPGTRLAEHEIWLRPRPAWMPRFVWRWLLRRLLWAVSRREVMTAAYGSIVKARDFVRVMDGENE